MGETLTGGSASCLLGFLLLASGLVTSMPVAGDGPGDLSLTAESGVDGNVRLYWTWLEDGRVDHYEVYWAASEIDVLDGMEARSNVLGNTFLVRGLEDGVRYHFAVTAVDVNGTVLAEDRAEAVPSLPVLKEVNYPNLMVALLLATVVFVFALVKVPTWTGHGRGGV